MSVVEPPAVPAAQPASPPSFQGSEADLAAQARLDAAFPKGQQPGDTPPPAAPDPANEPSVDLFDDEALDGLNFDGLAYRDGVKLRNDLVRARDTYKPFRDAFGTMTDESRQQLLDAAPYLGDDLGLVIDATAQLHPQDRAYFVNAMQLLATNPEEGAKALQAGAEQIRAAQAAGGLPVNTPAPAPAPQPAPVDPNMPEWAQLPGQAPQPAVDPLDQPMTRRQYQEEQAARESADEVNRLQTQILAEATELGYDPNAQVGTPEYDQFNFLLSVAGQPDVGYDLGKAHERVQGIKQAAIDEFVQAKSADAARPGAAPIIEGAPPAEVRTLESLGDAHAAMQARMTATLGPDPRARVAGD